MQSDHDSITKNRIDELHKMIGNRINEEFDASFTFKDFNYNITSYTLRN